MGAGPTLRESARESPVGSGSGVVHVVLGQCLSDTVRQAQRWSRGFVRQIPRRPLKSSEEQRPRSCDTCVRPRGFLFAPRAYLRPPSSSRPSPNTRLVKSSTPSTCTADHHRARVTAPARRLPTHCPSPPPLPTRRRLFGMRS